MSDVGPSAANSSPATVYCPQCGQAMRVAPQHVQITVACPHCQQTLEPWRLVGTVASRQAPTPPSRYDHPPQGLDGHSWRNRWVAGVLGVVLGALGVHRFYLGYTGVGIVQIVVTLATGGIGGLWGFIEGVLCLTGPVMRDVDGLPLRS